MQLHFLLPSWTLKSWMSGNIFLLSITQRKGRKGWKAGDGLRDVWGTKWSDSKMSLNDGGQLSCGYLHCRGVSPSALWAQKWAENHQHLSPKEPKAPPVREEQHKAEVFTCCCRIRLPAHQWWVILLLENYRKLTTWFWDNFLGIPTQRGTAINTKLHLQTSKGKHFISNLIGKQQSGGISWMTCSDWRAALGNSISCVRYDLYFTKQNGNTQQKCGPPTVGHNGNSTLNIDTSKAKVN